MSDTVTNALGFDLEHWYTATLLQDTVSDPVDRVVESTEIVTDILERHGVTATFFVVGEIAREHPELVARLADAGHEIGSHGQTHTPLSDQTPEEFERALRVSRATIFEAAGVDPIGFRAPNFSLTRDTAWAVDVLETSSYRYDSSLFPMRTPLYGVAGAPCRPYLLGSDDPFVAGSVSTPADPTHDPLVEIPLSVVGSRVRLPIAGGFYARITPRQLFETGIARLNRAGIPGNIYFHPWEFNPAVRTERPSLPARLISFVGIDRLPGILDSLLERFDFGPVRELYEATVETESRSTADAIRHT